MSDIEFKKIPLNEMFVYKRGVVLSQKYVREHKGSYPVYSSQTENEGIFGYIDTYMFDGEYITWTTDGVKAGTTFYRNGRFSCTNVCGIMMLKDTWKDVSLKYVNCFIDFKSIAKSSGNKKVMTSNIINANIELAFPVKKDGSLDFEQQERIVENYKRVEQQKNMLMEQRLKLSSSLVSANFASDYSHKDVKLTMLFTPKRGNSKYTKTYCFNNRGDYPIYSANNNEALAYANFYDYDGEYLTISVNGIAGKITLKEGKFSINADRVILVPIAKNVDLDYIKYTVEPILRSKIKGRRGHDGQNEFTKLPGGTIENVKISIPVDENGNYDLDAQKEISKKYQKIQNIIDSICKQIDDLTSIKISI